jgi:hypothetical protein
MVTELDFDDWLQKRKVKWWFTEEEAIVFPPLGSIKQEVTAPFVIEMISKLKDKLQTIIPIEEEDSLKSFPVVSGGLLTLGRRQPGVQAYTSTAGAAAGAFAVTMIAEIKGYYSEAKFNDEDIGQVIEFATELLRTQVFRESTISLLFDGVRFQFIKTNVRNMEFTHKLSSLYLGKEGWQVAVISLDFF